MKIKLITMILLINVAALSASAQTTEFAFQGSLKDGANAANGTYDFEFHLYDAVSGGNQIGSLVSRPNVAVAIGTFAVKLDFGNGFPGADRFLEIRVRNAGSGGYTILDPRQKVGSSPYAVKSLLADNANSATTAATATTANNSLQLGGVAANQFVQTGDPRLSDARNPLPGNSNYIQNTISPQASSDFNISGNGTAGGILTAGTVRANTQFNIGSNAVLRVNGGTLGPVSNTFAGVGAGLNSAPTSTLGLGNSFFGNEAGLANTVGESNSYFGYRAGASNGSSGNSFFGSSSGDITTAGNNSFFGSSSGTNNTAGQNNTFVGGVTGTTNTTGSSNTLIGANANVSNNNLSFATAIGSRASVAQSNSLILGGIDGINGATANTNVGIGTTTPSDRLHVNGIIRVETLGGAGATTLCRNTSNQISTCSSSLRYKSNINRFAFGLNLINQLKPITFDWKDGGIHDLGLGAEDVAAIEPLLVTYNNDGQVEGVKYDRIGVVLVNAVNEQQTQITSQQKEIDVQKAVIEKQQTEIELLRAHICSQSPSAIVCKPRN